MAPPRPPARPSYWARRRARRAARARRLAARMARQDVVTLPQLGSLPDPLARAPRRGRAGVGALMLAGALLAHAAVLATFAGLGVAMRAGAPAAAPRWERVEATLVEPAPPPPAAPAAVEPPPPEAAAAPKPRPRPAPKAAPAEPPPDPVDVPPDLPEPAAQPPRATPRRIVGLSLESTVTGGTGPGFAVGNTRMGQGERTAADPRAVEKLPPSNAPATRLPAGPSRLTSPRKLRTVEPTYPPALEAQGLEADVVLRVTVGPDGRVTDVAVVKGAAHPAFDEAAVRAARAEVYAPALRDGEPVAHGIRFTVRFRLSDY